jgi:hypothetical protein
MDPALLDRIKAEAEADRRSMAWMLAELVTEALDARHAAVTE